MSASRVRRRSQKHLEGLPEDVHTFYQTIGPLTPENRTSRLSLLAKTQLQYGSPPKNTGVKVTAKSFKSEAASVQARQQLFGVLGGEETDLATTRKRLRSAEQLPDATAVYLIYLFVLQWLQQEVTKFALEGDDTFDTDYFELLETWSPKPFNHRQLQDMKDYCATLLEDIPETEDGRLYLDALANSCVQHETLTPDAVAARTLSAASAAAGVGTLDEPFTAREAFTSVANDDGGAQAKLADDTRSHRGRRRGRSKKTPAATMSSTAMAWSVRLLESFSVEKTVSALRLRGALMAMQGHSLMGFSVFLEYTCVAWFFFLLSACVRGQTEDDGWTETWGSAVAAMFMGIVGLARDVGLSALEKVDSDIYRALQTDLYRTSWFLTPGISMAKFVLKQVPFVTTVSTVGLRLSKHFGIFMVLNNVVIYRENVLPWLIGMADLLYPPIQGIVRASDPAQLRAALFWATASLFEGTLAASIARMLFNNFWMQGRSALKWFYLLHGLSMGKEGPRLTDYVAKADQLQKDYLPASLSGANQTTSYVSFLKVLEGSSTPTELDKAMSESFFLQAALDPAQALAGMGDTFAYWRDTLYPWVFGKKWKPLPDVAPVLDDTFKVIRSADTTGVTTDTSLLAPDTADVVQNTLLLAPDTADTAQQTLRLAPDTAEFTQQTLRLTPDTAEIAQQTPPSVTDDPEESLVARMDRLMNNAISEAKSKEMALYKITTTVRDSPLINETQRESIDAYLEGYSLGKYSDINAQDAGFKSTFGPIYNQYRRQSPTAINAVDGWNWYAGTGDPLLIRNMTRVALLQVELGDTSHAKQLAEDWLVPFTVEQVDAYSEYIRGNTKVDLGAVMEVQAAARACELAHFRIETSDSAVAMQGPSEDDFADIESSFRLIRQYTDFVDAYYDAKTKADAQKALKMFRLQVQSKLRWANSKGWFTTRSFGTRVLQNIEDVMEGKSRLIPKRDMDFAVMKFVQSANDALLGASVWQTTYDLKLGTPEKSTFTKYVEYYKPWATPDAPTTYQRFRSLIGESAASKLPTFDIFETKTDRRLAEIIVGVYDDIPFETVFTQPEIEDLQEQVSRLDQQQFLQPTTNAFASIGQLLASLAATGMIAN